MSVTGKRVRGAGKPAGDPARKKLKVSPAGLIAGAAGERDVQPDDVSEPSSEEGALVGPVAGPAEGAAAAAAPGGNNFWIFEKTGDIPLGVRSKQIASCHIEFLQVDQQRGHDFNHSIMRLTYVHPQAHNTDHAPAGTRGVVIDWDVHSGTDGFAVPAHVRVRNFSYAPPHRLANFVKEIPMGVGRTRRNRHKTVGDFLRVLARSALLPSAFTNWENIAAVGCRDCLSQYLTHLNEARIVNIAIGGANLNYEFFNFLYIYDEGAFPDEVYRARFTNDYVHVLIPEINYDGESKFSIHLSYNINFDLLVNASANLNSSHNSCYMGPDYFCSGR
ncbi:hypothetical protein N7540_004237 [Penicillium herquei]|nr:hypothetical protein N7540_004237 [Penicillium herquei]